MSSVEVTVDKGTHIPLAGCAIQTAGMARWQCTKCLGLRLAVAPDWEGGRG